jgi:hypothetical protein
MPRVYALPGKTPDGSGLTHYQVFVGPGTAFEATRLIRIVDVTDGARSDSTIPGRAERGGPNDSVPAAAMRARSRVGGNHPEKPGCHRPSFAAQAGRSRV